jgi:hypothetical protein
MLGIMPLAIGHGAGSWSLENILVAIVVIAAAIGILLVALRAFGLSLPQWVVQILLICAAAFLAVCAIKFVLTL